MDLPADQYEALRHVARVLKLSDAELGTAFGTTASEVSRWSAAGVPARLEAKLDTLEQITNLLDRKLRAGATPGVARRPAEAYEGRSMLDLVAADEHERLLRDLQSSFDWTRSI